MQLLSFAHRGEASEFINQLSFTRLNLTIPDVYQAGSEYLLMITGEGTLEAAAKIAAVVGKFAEQITRITNLGTAAALSDHIEIGSLVPVRTVYMQRERRAMGYKSFTSADPEAALDCISARDRITESDEAQYLSSFGQIADRELWGIASVSHLFNLPFYALKLVSDRPPNVDCGAIRANAPEISLILYKQWLANYAEHSPHVSHQQLQLPTGFYATSAQINQIRKLLRLHRKTGLLEILGAERLAKICKKVPHPKKRTSLLIDELGRLLDPWYYKLQQALEREVAPLTRSRCKIAFAENYETDQVTLTAKIASEREWLGLKESLSAVSFARISSILNGKIENAH